VLRNGGIYFDSQNTVGDSDTLNTPIFASIDRAAGMVFISDFARRLVEAFYRPLTIPYTVIHNAVNISRFRPEGTNYRSTLHLTPDDVVMVTAAKWRRWKRLKETVIFFKKLQAELPGRRFKLLVLGEHPDYIVDDSDIIYAGEIPPEELPAWYRTGNLYLHLATLEICGNTQVEAIACGLPVLCANNGGIGETVRAARAGIVSEADQPFRFEKVAHYDPPAPDYERLLADMRTLLDNYRFYQEHISYDAVSIDASARKYVQFISEVFLRHLTWEYRIFPYAAYRLTRSIKKLRHVPSRLKGRLHKYLSGR
jgi:glycosyltransferase involved in cell wall biosynthesis